MSATSAIHGAANDAVDEVAPWIEWLARLGYAAKALLYITVGALAGAAALGLGGTVQGSRGAMGKILHAPFGRLLIVVIAIGLLGYAAWRLVGAIFDPERHGKDLKGIAHRVRDAGTGIIHGALGISAVRLAMGHYAAAGHDGDAQKHWTARALATPGGELAVAAVAIGVVIYGLYQLYRAWKAKLNKQLALHTLSWKTARTLIGISRFGIAARGVVFIAAGGLAARAARHHDAGEAGGVAQSLRELFEFGRGPFLVIAAGLIAYGIYELINARYRRIHVA